MYRIPKQDLQKRDKDCTLCEQVNQKAIKGTACVDNVVQDGTTYIYVAKAVNKYGQPSGFSNDTLAPIPPTVEVNGPVVPKAYPSCRQNNE
ncbi:MAG TPA: hypothetical protein VH350_16950 [Candidatus Sulfotelmatobacter sp.]|nr:hypothetical protein [Candidatus Sulfotelmatobacter sp.]